MVAACRRTSTARSRTCAKGSKSGYTSPKLNVRIVIDQVRSLAATPVKDSPFGSPAERDNSPEFQKAFTRSSPSRSSPR